MKLISKTLLFYLLISMPLLVIAGLLSYHLISQEIKDGVDEALLREKHHLESAIIKSNEPLNINLNELTTITTAPGNLEGHTFSNKLIYDSLEQENIDYRIISSYFKKENKNYKLEIHRPTMEEEELLEGLVSSFILIVSFLVLAFFALSWLLSKTLWKPFYLTVEKLNAYDIKNHSFTNFEKSGTKEFNSLNESLNKMTEKIHSDFLQQKEFTENASHEMQTPLAVIKANIGLLIQSPNLTEQEMGQLAAIDDTTKKLASLNKALLLLAKIENNQFKEAEIIDIEKTIRKIKENFEDLLDTKEIKLNTQITSPLSVKMNSALADILFTNLLQNAIRHNFKGGEIKIELSTQSITISNTGENLKVKPDDLFTRFKKNEASNESMGLGLAIVQSICVLYGIEIQYDFKSRFHSFALNFKN
ncbi:type IX secretion system histidine kinase PorY [Aurantibacillus circumpalustris]|uniref:PorY family sensor histidine kinase n=1 Tax=Aurantibacillus circumpalustris TaxID=3036359 RepID=UPI00295B2597|nr:HAMP domain-containing sensor histidine kinase [Aurantibacillus circumpalustris]